MAVISYATVHGKPFLIWLNFGVILIFYFYEVSYRIIQGSLLERSKEVQKLLRKGDSNTTDENNPPYLDKYFPAERDWRIVWKEVNSALDSHASLCLIWQQCHQRNCYSVALEMQTAFHIKAPVTARCLIAHLEHKPRSKKSAPKIQKQG